MKIVIPMSGLGKRFADAGYKDIKPLIEVNGKPIIEWVVNLFPGDNDFIFICRNEHLENTPVRDVLNRIAPNGKIIGIDGHKFGPVYAVAQVFNLIDDDDQVIVNYCDFYQDWDFEDFKAWTNTTRCDGAVPCYTGFHPHLLHPKNLYASCQVDEALNMIEIREKYSFEVDKMKAYHSGGTYYFSKGSSVKKYFQMMMDEDISLNGEYYVSLVYNLLNRDGLNVKIYDKVPHFCQWGTPEDLEEYLTWSKIIEHYKK
ncbi:MAG: glycosyltransferase family 2 protein [Bacteroidia bacterium]|nr:glycosyltransferase family 2 protein [Bacteroidia bacterium]